jgi:uncharacterized repeat protein (TIGR01451 family)
MSSKQIIVGILFLITLLLIGVTIYLAVTLGSKSGGNIITTPTPSLQLTQTPSITPSTLPEVECGKTCDKAKCQDGYSCVTVNTIKRCVLNTCLNKSTTPVTINNNCNNDLCTLKTNLEVDKKAEISCLNGSAGGNKVKLIITLTNTSENEISNITLTDDLTSSISINYLKNDSISNNGKSQESKIIWENITLAAYNGSIELSYELEVPAEENGKSYTDIVIATKDSSVLANVTFRLNIEILPCTALENDQIMFIIAGALLVIMGMIFVSKDYDSKLGRFLWSNGLSNIIETGNTLIKPITNSIQNIKKQFNLSIKEKLGHKNLKFEDRVIKDREN